MRKLLNPRLERGEVRIEDIELDHKCRDDLSAILIGRAFCKTQANSSSDIASLHDDWILVSTLHDSLDLAAKFRPDSTKNPFKPSKRV